MLKSDLVRKIADKYRSFYIKDIENVVDAFFDKISDSLAEGKRVEFRGFGSLYVKNRDARAAINPLTGAKIKVKAKKFPHFKSSKYLYDSLNK